DDCGNTATCSRSVDVIDNIAPVINCPTVVSPVQCPNGPVFGDASASDLCDLSVAITFSDASTAGACAGTYTTTRTWTATDDCGNTATCSRSIDVIDNIAPVINCPTVISPVQCPNGPIFGDASASDLCDLSVAITFSDASTAGACAGTYTTTRTWTATDDCGNTATCSRSIDVIDNIAPVINCPTVISPVQCPNGPIFGDASASDLCDLSVAITFSDASTAGACAGTYTTTRTWTATDDCGNTATCSRSIDVIDNIAPVINCPTVISPVQCPNGPVFGDASATDPCDQSVAITFSDASSAGACAGTYTTTRTWTATDDCGNTATCSRSIDVIDNIAPVINCPTVISPVQCPNGPVFGDASATDLCDQSVAITFSDASTAGPCAGTYTTTRTWTAT